MSGHSEPVIEHVDVLVVGAGISGIGAGCHLLQQRPEAQFLILEAMDDFGGTWQTHRYPGARSDSDLFTFGYRFKPWTGAPIASSEQILAFIEETAPTRDWLAFQEHHQFSYIYHQVGLG